MTSSLWDKAKAAMALAAFVAVASLVGVVAFRLVCDICRCLEGFEAMIGRLLAQ